jgi:hypothetical protein
MAYSEHNLNPSGLKNEQSSGSTLTTDLCMPDTGRTFGVYLTTGQPGSGAGNVTPGQDGHIWASTWSGATTYGVQLYMDTDPTNYTAIKAVKDANPKP